jgi:hypothetical protein
MRINDLLAMIEPSNEQKAINDALAKHGSNSPEYRRAWRRQYRSYAHRVDYYADRSATKALDQAMANGWALSQSDAINQALRAWADWMAEGDCPE